jgi:transposase
MPNYPQVQGHPHNEHHSDEGGENWACLASLTETCKLNGVNPQAYFTDLLTRLVNGWPQNRIDELMPWHWTPEQPTK